MRTIMDVRIALVAMISIFPAMATADIYYVACTLYSDPYNEMGTPIFVVEANSEHDASEAKTRSMIDNWIRSQGGHTPAAMACSANKDRSVVEGWIREWPAGRRRLAMQQPLPGEYVEKAVASAAPATTASATSKNPTNTPSAEKKATGPLAVVSKCAQFIPSKTGGGDWNYIRNTCKDVTIQVTFCYHGLQRKNNQFDALDCNRGQFGTTAPIAPGHKQSITFVPASILTFVCPYPEGALDLGAGIGKLIPVTSRTKFSCHRL